MRFLILFFLILTSFPVLADITVQQGDTLYSLSKKHNIPLDSLAKMNSIEPPYGLKIGQVLKISQEEVPAVKPQVPKKDSIRHTVQAGETLFGIARQYDLSVDDLKKLNSLRDQNLKVGQMLRLSQMLIPLSDSLMSVSRAPKSYDFLKNETVVHWQKPLDGELVSGFGTKSNGLKNNGVNIEATRGTSVQSAEKGVVVYAGNGIKGLGNTVILKHALNYITVYSHLDQIIVTYDDRLEQGEKLGTVGLSGKVQSPQLHFEVRENLRPQNPEKVLKL